MVNEVVADSDQQATVFHLDYTPAGAPPSSKAQDSPSFIHLGARRKAPLPDFSTSSPEVLRCKSITSFDCREWRVRDFLFVDNNTIAALTPSAVLFLTRESVLAPAAVAAPPNPAPLSPAPPARPFSDDDSRGSLSAMEEEDSLQNFHFTSMLQFRLPHGHSTEPLRFESLPGRRLLAIVCSGGRLLVLQYQELHSRHLHDFVTDASSINTNVLPSLLLAEVILPSGEDIVQVLPNRCSQTFGPESYLVEAWVESSTSSSSRVLRLVGIRELDVPYCPPHVDFGEEAADNTEETKQEVEDGSVVSAKSLARYFEEVDLRGPAYLAEADLLAEQSFKLPPSKLKLPPPFTSSSCCPRQPHLLSFEASVSRRLVYSFAGELSVLELMSPHRLVVGVRQRWGRKKAKNDNQIQADQFISSCTRGPDIFASSTIVGEPEEAQEEAVVTLFMLRKDNSVDMVAGDSGRRLFSLPLAHLLSSSAGSAEVVEWCPYTNRLLVGTSSGALLALSPDSSSSSAFSFLPAASLSATTSIEAAHSRALFAQTQEVHGCKLSLVRTFPFRRFHSLNDDPLQPEEGQEIVVLLLGDIQGHLSLWQLHPPAPASAAKKSNLLLFFSQQHVGSLIHASLCLLPPGLLVHSVSSANIPPPTPTATLVTACSHGKVIAWRIQRTLNLTMTTFFQSSCISSSSSTLVGSEVGNIATNRATTSKNHLSSCFVLPKMVYRKQLLPISSVSFSPIPSAGNLKDRTENSKEEVVATACYEIYAVLGWADGTLEFWSLAAESAFLLLRPLPFPAAALSLRPLSSSFNAESERGMERWFTLASRPEDFLWPAAQSSSPFPTRSVEDVICGFSDGTVAVVEVRIDAFHEEGGLIVRVKHFLRLPCPLLFLLPAQCSILSVKTLRAAQCKPTKERNAQGREVVVRDYFFVGTLDVYRFLPLLSEAKALPHIWRRPLLPQSSPHLSNTFVQPLADSQNRTLHAEGGQRVIDVMEEYSQRSLLLQDAPSLDGSQSFASKTSFSSSRATEDDDEHDDDRRRYVGPLEGMQRIVSSDLYMAKKDRRLLDLFQQNADGTNHLTMTADRVANLVQKWCSTSTSSFDIKTENLLELFKLLDIHTDDRLHFVEVAKIAAIVQTAVKKIPSTTQKKKPYRELRGTKTRVRYNSLGEKVIEKLELSEDIRDGGGALRQWQDYLRDYLHTHRSAIQRLRDDLALRRMEKKRSPRRLRTLPPGPLQTLPLPENYLELPWSPEDAIYLEETRALAIARTLLDMRASFQYEARPTDNTAIAQSLSLLAPRAASTVVVPSIASLLLKHLERLYGQDVARGKAIAFLEACLQYNHLPILRLLCHPLGLENAVHETALWLVAEARSLLFSRGQVSLRHSLAYADDPFKTQNTAGGGEGNMLIVSRAAALAVCDDLLRVRGYFGPRTYLDLFDTIQALPDAEQAEDQQQHEEKEEDNIDLDQFLETFYFCYLRKDEQIRGLQRSLFGCLSSATSTASSTRIVTPLEGKRLKQPVEGVLLSDELEMSTDPGPFHSSNLSFILQLLRGCMRRDSLRTGQLTRREVGDELHAIVGEDYSAILEAAIKKMKLRSSEEVWRSLSYIDLVALLLSCEEAVVQGEEDFRHAKSLARALQTLGRAIEIVQAKELVKYFSMASALSEADDPLWVLGEHKPLLSSSSAIATSSSTSTLPAALSRDGLWRRDVALPDDQPGLLTVQQLAVEAAPAGAAAPGEKRVREGMPPMPIYKKAPTSQPRKGPAPITIVSVDLPSGTKTMMPSSAGTSPATTAGDLVDRQSFSRAMGRIEVLPLEEGGEMEEVVGGDNVSGLPKPMPQLEEASLDSNYQLYDLSAWMDQSESTASSQEAQDHEGKKTAAGLQEESGGRGDDLLRSLTPFRETPPLLLLLPRQPSTAKGHNSVSSFDPSQLEAEAEVFKRLQEAVQEEQRLAVDYEEEQRLLLQRRQEKEALREQLRREMEEKEREGLRVYREGLQRRSRRMERAQARLKAQEEELQEEQAIRRQLETNRFRALSRLQKSAPGSQGSALQDSLEGAEEEEEETEEDWKNR